jgi:hypothetical protein
MAPRKAATPKRSAAYYRSNPEAYAKKLAYDTKENKSLRIGNIEQNLPKLRVNVA